MKRTILAFAVCALLVFGWVPAKAATVTYYDSYSFNSYYSDGPNSVYVMANASIDRTGNQAPIYWAYAQVQTPAGTSYGSGSATLSLDPVLLTGSLTGTIPGSDGDITLNLQFLGLNVNSNVPYVNGEVVPPPGPQVVVQYNLGRQGRSNGTAFSTGSGLVNVVNAYASAGDFTVISATA